MGKGKTKDRTARWAKIEHLLYQNRNGLKIKEIARICNVSVRQIYRDINDLQLKLGFPIGRKVAHAVSMKNTSCLLSALVCLRQSMYSSLPD